jgi:hypothetical protein
LMLLLPNSDVLVPPCIEFAASSRASFGLFFLDFGDSHWRMARRTLEQKQNARDGRELDKGGGSSVEGSRKEEFGWSFLDEHYSKICKGLNQQDFGGRK